MIEALLWLQRTSAPWTAMRIDDLDLLATAALSPTTALKAGQSAYPLLVITEFLTSAQNLMGGRRRGIAFPGGFGMIGLLLAAEAAN